jgi:hypothetical protein
MMEDAIPAVSKPDILSNPLVLFGTMYSIRSYLPLIKNIIITSTGYYSSRFLNPFQTALIVMVWSTNENLFPQ